MVDQYAHKVRVRCCGLLFIENKLLLLKHAGLGDGFMWSPPGGGIEFGEPAGQCLQREFLEETGLSVDIGPFLFIHEHREERLHAIELFFHVTNPVGDPSLGTDPESTHQLLEELLFFSEDELLAVPSGKKHAILHHFNSFDALLNLTGFYNFTHDSDYSQPKSDH